MRLPGRTLFAAAAALLVLAAFALVLRHGGRTGNAVLVTVDGKPYGSYPLHTDAVVTIAPEDAAWYNLLTIRDGTARITESDCANQTCVHTPALTENTVGVIVCLPHGVVVLLS